MEACWIVLATHARATWLYQQLAQQLLNSTYLASVDYGPDFEAYVFHRGTQDVHVVWSKLDVPDLSILVPVQAISSRHACAMAR